MIINQIIKGKGGGSAPAVVAPLSVNPSKTAQTITVPQGVDGYNPVSVAAVTAAIDSNIVSTNIKSGVSILGVDGSVVELSGTTANVTPSTVLQTITPTSPSNGFTSVTVNPVDNTIDGNILSGNIKSGVSILGVEGSVVELNGSTKTVTPSGTQQVITPTAPSNGLTSVTVEAAPVTTKNITANGTYNAPDPYVGYSSVTVAVPLPVGSTTLSSNGTYNVTDYQTAIVDVPQPQTETKTITVNGTYTPSAGKVGFSSVTVNVSGSTPVLDTLSVTPTTSQQILTPTSPSIGYSSVTVGAVDDTIDSNIVAGNIKSGVSILGVTGSVVELNGSSRSVLLESSAGDTYLPADGKNAITSITVTPKNQNKTVTPSATSQTINVPAGYSGFGTITVDPAALETKSITTNGTHTPTSPNIGFSSVTVAVPNGTETKNITANGTYTPTSPNIGFSSVTVAVPQPTGSTTLTTNGSHNVSSYATAVVAVPNGTETKSITSNGTYTPTSPNIGFSSVVVAVPNGTETKTITSNGTYTPSGSNIGFSSVTVNVTPQPPVLDTLTASPAVTQQTYTPTSPYVGYSSVTVNPVTSSIDANITAGNIKDGVTILGVTGTYTGTGPTVFGLPLTAVYGTLVNGSLTETTGGTPNFTGLTTIDTNKLSRLFYSNSLITGSISFPDLTTWVNSSAYDMSLAFDGTSITSFSMDYITTIPSSVQNALESTLQNCANLTSVSLNSLTTADGSDALFFFVADCPALTTLNLQNLTSAMGSYSMARICSGCTNLVNVNMDSLKDVNSLSYAFYNCTSLTKQTIFPNLEQVKDSSGLQFAFYNCTSLVKQYFPKLKTFSQYTPRTFQSAFSGCTSLTDVYFNAVTTTSFNSSTYVFQYMLTGCTGVKLHFPSNMSSVISGMSGYPNFGGTNTTVLFDLTATS